MMLSNEDNENSSKIISFRLSTSTINQMKNEAKNKKVSLNSIVSKVLTKYTQWDTHTKEMSVVPIPKFILKQMFDEMEIHSIDKLIESFHEYIKECTILAKEKYEFQQCMLFLKLYFNELGFHTKDAFDNNAYHYTVHHKLGLKWSILIEGLIKKICEEFNEDKDPKFLLTPSTIKISVFLHD